jgi:enoyl-CoA hydratase
MSANEVTLPPAVLSEDLPGGVRLLTLNRPKGNVLSFEMVEALSAAVKAAVHDPAVRALLFRGTGDVFCAGLDFRTLKQVLMQGEQAMLGFGNAADQAMMDIWTCPKPTVAAVTGHAIAGGYFIAMACDMRYVIEGPARFGINELAFGAGFSLTGIEIGRWALQQQMAQAIQGTELFDWQQGLRNGSFHASFADEAALLVAAAAQAAKLGAMPTEAYANVKAQLLAPYLQRVYAQTEEEKLGPVRIFFKPETQQALMAYAASVTRQAKPAAA